MNAQMQINYMPFPLRYERIRNRVFLINGNFEVRSVYVMDNSSVWLNFY